MNAKKKWSKEFLMLGMKVLSILSSDNYIRIAGTSASTATRDLSDFINKKIILKTGNLKGTRYRLNLEDWIELKVF